MVKLFRVRDVGTWFNIASGRKRPRGSDGRGETPSCVLLWPPKALPSVKSVKSVVIIPSMPLSKIHAFILPILSKPAPSASICDNLWPKPAFSGQSQSKPVKPHDQTLPTRFFCRYGTQRTQSQQLMLFILCDPCVLLWPYPILSNQFHSRRFKAASRLIKANQAIFLIRNPDSWSRISRVSRSKGFSRAGIRGRFWRLPGEGRRG